MSIKKPYYRIARVESGTEYILDRRYAPDRFTLIQSYQLIENDLKKILEYIEPVDENMHVFSHRLYELLLRSATEFETNCKGILNANGYKKRGNLDITDYRKINKATRVSEYQIKMNFWYPVVKIIMPLSDWSKSQSLNWYKNYNLVKHDRVNYFSLAKLENVIYAVASVLIILYSQFNEYAFNPYNDETMLVQKDKDDFWYGANSLFNIKPYENWSAPDQYYFAWPAIETTESPFEKYAF
ncbi:MAG: hypothetical protein COY66_04250 [Candidatus Kerfeldbacteria bacterium CG_4_10_14_0_8_um_filter_42_10]|uniref:Uncharacterized protein n=1 Tax=Candidatus Kerfeldbacteria bacterium CG_4_10_14_0_8_um_filter_42_10 TaxID=2014248 RepID=A0A2M7RHU6_9BACT|nr:MAG: hypothetical protein COY66_04250 [Candidatus Kerfeldbacteria bacterium CG_4_10_14_0_8_um_filter_42_10]